MLIELQKHTYFTLKYTILLKFELEISILIKYIFKVQYEKHI